MSRGNQREKDRQANLDKQKKLKAGNNKSGTKMQQEKETAAEIMRRKQAASDARKAGTAGKK
ncbi:hypothetical protein FOQG_09889 [Fusarium oxysporum f. sp. raphani 54005]|uniref:Small EDRK-rich factor-like N-terminal domain-containing protein n=7 Tax=Fusarium oxysporum TaxID=5507 RepID=A0A8J5NLB5_FUSOX|nr:putative serf family protein [Fusarium oxysporum Fo47]EWZ96723.1 hypothetical protein FOWG_04003 [Fusarium oxysporum f. sp. lycopersici MN25]EXK34948.1 hypothetical protein FOMG_10258 [Fusarium oxysporum f. sp. melonis 26406]EXK86172.1 hypothetical protein FOQG_09889 [Fusarium oxysporum f. sp. raphani 54005]EXL54820.1 hypothetical protein FOCG_05618 [Fusarium oxysporum f. sp. radicis-lycopersici 26381]EXL78717.1 hypothetical protein FOPG_07167 [Fusarium oxysporum f. sp. conglutinans race 2 